MIKALVVIMGGLTSALSVVGAAYCAVHEASGWTIAGFLFVALMTHTAYRTTSSGLKEITDQEQGA